MKNITVKQAAKRLSDASRMPLASIDRGLAIAALHGVVAIAEKGMDGFRTSEQKANDLACMAALARMAEYAFSHQGQEEKIYSYHL